MELPTTQPFQVLFSQWLEIPEFQQEKIAEDKIKQFAQTHWISSEGRFIESKKSNKLQTKKNRDSVKPFANFLKTFVGTDIAGKNTQQFLLMMAIINEIAKKALEIKIEVNDKLRFQKEFQCYKSKILPVLRSLSQDQLPKKSPCFGTFISDVLFEGGKYTADLQKDRPLLMLVEGMPTISILDFGVPPEASTKEELLFYFHLYFLLEKQEQRQQFTAEIIIQRSFKLPTPTRKGKASKLFNEIIDEVPVPQLIYFLQKNANKFEEIHFMIPSLVNRADAADWRILLRDFPHFPLKEDYAWSLLCSYLANTKQVTTVYLQYVNQLIAKFSEKFLEKKQGDPLWGTLATFFCAPGVYLVEGHMRIGRCALEGKHISDRLFYYLHLCELQTEQIARLDCSQLPKISSALVSYVGRFPQIRLENSRKVPLAGEIALKYGAATIRVTKEMLEKTTFDLSGSSGLDVTNRVNQILNDFFPRTMPAEEIERKKREAFEEFIFFLRDNQTMRWSYQSDLLRYICIMQLVTSFAQTPQIVVMIKRLKRDLQQFVPTLLKIYVDSQQKRHGIQTDIYKINDHILCLNILLAKLHAKFSSSCLSFQSKKVQKIIESFKEIVSGFDRERKNRKDTKNAMQMTLNQLKTNAKLMQQQHGSLLNLDEIPAAETEDGGMHLYLFSQYVEIIGKFVFVLSEILAAQNTYEFKES